MPSFLLAAQVQQLQLKSMVASSSSQDSVALTGNAGPANTSRAASHPQPDQTPAAGSGQADSAETSGTADSAELSRLQGELGRLQSERGVLAARLGTAEHQLAEARQAVDQKEGLLQGLQVILPSASVLVTSAISCWFCALSGCNMFCSDPRPDHLFICLLPGLLVSAVGKPYPLDVEVFVSDTCLAKTP